MSVCWPPLAERECPRHVAHAIAEAAVNLCKREAKNMCGKEDENVCKRAAESHRIRAEDLCVHAMDLCTHEMAEAAEDLLPCSEAERCSAPLPD